MNKHNISKYFILPVLPVLFGLFAISGSADGYAEFSISSAGQRFNTGDSFTADIMIKPNGQTYDSVRLKMNYSSELLEVQQIKLNESYKFTYPDNGYDNGSGVLSYGAGIPGGTNESSTFGKISFKAKKDGEAKIMIEPESTILSNGENIFSGMPAVQTYTLSAPAPQTPEKKPEETKPVAKNPAVAKSDEIEEKPAPAENLPAAVVQAKVIEENPQSGKGFIAKYGLSAIFVIAGLIALLMLLVSFILPSEEIKKIKARRQR